MENARPALGRTGACPALSCLLGRSQVHRRIFAAAIDLDLELQSVALVQRGHPGALDGRDVDERIGLPVIALDEAEAFHRVEELDRAAGFLAGQLALRAAVAAAGAPAVAVTAAA